MAVGIERWPSNETFSLPAIIILLDYVDVNEAMHTAKVLQMHP